MLLDYIWLVLLAFMASVFLIAIFKVTGQRKRQNDLLERIAIALERRGGA